MARSATGESVLSRAVRIFEAFTPDERVLSVSQIARRARLHLATASRLIAELESHGLLDREPDRRVRVGAARRAGRPRRDGGGAGRDRPGRRRGDDRGRGPEHGGARDQPDARRPGGGIRWPGGGWLGRAIA
jgi:hypothetical protein